MSQYGEAVFAPGEITVGVRAEFSLIYTVGDVPIAPEGGIRIRLAREGDAVCVSAATSGRGSRVRLLPERSGAKELSVVAADARLTKGDTITVHFANAPQGGAMSEIQSVTRTCRAMVWVDPDGSRNYVKLGDAPTLHVVAAKPARLIALAPSQAVAGKKFDVHVKALDEFGNPVPSYRGTVYFVSQECDLLPPEYAFRAEDAGARRFAAAAASAKPGFNRITVKDKESGLSATTNPIDILGKEPDYHMYWGEIHGRSSFSDGVASPDEYYRHARDVEMLDVCAVSDADTAGDEAWAILRYEAARFYRPGTFVTLLAYEWASGQSGASDGMSFGHKNVYYCDDDQPVHRHDRTESNTPRKLYHLLRHTRALIMPHHTSAPIHPEQDGPEGADPTSRRAAGNDWRYHDPEKERLVEIYSKSGNSEFPGCPRPVRGAEPGGFVQEALARGCRLGFTAGGNEHYGRPGANVAEGGPCRQNGITLFLAEKLTRESIFEAMCARRCYATTGARIFLDFKINGFCMGEEIVANDPEESRVVSVRVAGMAGIDHVDIVKNNDDLYRQDGTGPAAEFEYVDQTPVSGTDFYYVRVTQADEEMAWSSPIWVSARK